MDFFLLILRLQLSCTLLKSYITTFVYDVFFIIEQTPFVNYMLINMFFDFFQLIIYCNFLKDLGQEWPSNAIMENVTDTIWRQIKKNAILTLFPECMCVGDL